MTSRTKLAIGLLSAAAIMILLGGLSHSWWTRERDSGRWEGMGFVDTKRCARDGCGTRSILEQVRSDDKPWATIGAMAYYMTFASALIMLVAAGAAATRKASASMRKLARSAWGSAASMLFVALLFIGMAPSAVWKGESTVGFSMFVYLAGTIAGIVGGVFLAKEVASGAVAQGAYPGQQPYPQPQQQPYPQPPQQQPYPQQPPPPQAQPPAPACNRCNAPLRYVAEYQRYYCDSCQAYV